MKTTKKFGTAAAAATGAILLTMWGGSAAFAAEGDPITIEPGSIASGDEVTISGADCLGAGSEVIFSIVAPDGTPVPSAEEVTVTPEEDGTWVAAGALTGEPGEYTVNASCAYYEGGGFAYAANSITVTGDDSGAGGMAEGTADAGAAAEGNADAGGTGADGNDDAAGAGANGNAGSAANGGTGANGNLANTGSDSMGGMVALGVAGAAAVAGAALLLARRRHAAE